MSQLPSIANSPPAAGSKQDVARALNEVDMDDFLQLMIAELQNQDPLNPLDNTDMLQQISQIREVGATDRLTETLDAVLLRQNVANATNLIGQEARGLTDDGQSVQGLVRRVTIAGGTPTLHLDGEPSAEASSSDGTLDEGTYSYKVVFTRGEGQTPQALDIGPISTTGTEGVDQAIRLANLPVTEGQKTIYRTRAGGTGDYYFVDQINGSLGSYTDGTGDAQLSGGTLTGTTVPLSGSRTYTVKLDNIAEIRLREGGN